MSTAAAATALPPTDRELLLLDDPATAAELAAAPPVPPPVRIDPADPAYLIFTSGSTGRPKGVVVPHRGIVNRLLWMQAEYGLGPEDRVLQKTPSSFDVSVWEFFWPLVVGATLVVARPGGHREPAYLAELIGRERITTLHFVPSMLEAFLGSIAGTPGRRRVHLAATGDLLRRGAAGRRGKPVPGHVRCRRCRAAQPVRPDRGLGRRDVLALPARRGYRPDRPPGLEHPGIRARPGPAAGAAGRARRALPGRHPSWLRGTWSAAG